MKPNLNKMDKKINFQDMVSKSVNNAEIEMIRQTGNTLKDCFEMVTGEKMPTMDEIDEYIHNIITNQENY